MYHQRGQTGKPWRQYFVSELVTYMELLYQVFLGFSITAALTTAVCVLRQFSIIGNFLTALCECLCLPNQTLHPPHHLDTHTLRVHYKSGQVEIEGLPEVTPDTPSVRPTAPVRPRAQEDCVVQVTSPDNSQERGSIVLHPIPKEEKQFLPASACRVSYTPNV